MPRLARPRFVWVLLCLLLLLVVSTTLPAMERPGPSRALGILGLLVPILGVAAAGDTGRQRNVAFGLAAACLLLSADGLSGLSRLPPQAGVAAAVLFLGYSTTRLLAGVLRSERVTADVVAGAVAGYVMIGMTWAFAYGLVETLRPGSIGGNVEGAPALSTLTYLSFITLLSIGYGDVTPVSGPARTLAILEGLVGMTFTTIILAALVASHLSHRASGPRA